MSSATMQPNPPRMQAPQSPYAPDVAARQRAPPSQQNRDVYYANQNISPSHSPQVSRRQGPQKSYDSQPIPPASPPYSSPSTAAYVSPETPNKPPSQAAGRHRPTTSDQYDGPPIPPPRSSSQQPTIPAMAAPSTAPLESRAATARQARQNADDARLYEGRSHGQNDSRVDASRDVTSKVTTPSSRRKALPSPDTPGATSEREGGIRPGGSGPVRPDGGVGRGTASAPLSRENSEVINRIVVSNPAVDITREEERMAEARPATKPADRSAGPGSSGVESEAVGDGSPRRQDYSKQSTRRKDVQFGEYMLGRTLGEGEFGKVKLGWKRDGTVQVAIKLIRRETVATNPSRLPKIYREISILRELSHPNIVRLHEMVETDRHIGIILEYASGGELFDYILKHRYLKDPAARRLFAQLVSGVGYLHKKGIVHRDLKLENLLLDSHRNIIITDFGFANTFNPADDLSNEIVYNLGNREFVKKYRLDRQDDRGMRRGDLMQTSCGSPCYAAPELVVSDSLYIGRKVDVWSCGVILYAMLAGYLPFDDDPANPEGDNINLLYKYITTTALTFPEYVTPHARDLLRRILVPDPRKRADLFEVARHSWLNEYHHVVSHITSSTTNIADIANSTVPSEDQEDSPSLARSASVREPAKSAAQSPSSPAGALNHQPAQVDEDAESAARRGNVNRHTIQHEYVEPRSHTTRGEVPAATAIPTTRARGGSHGPLGATAQPGTRSKPLPQEPTSNEATKVADYPTVPGNNPQRMPPPTRPARDVPRSVSDSVGAFTTTTSEPALNHASATRPSTANAPPSSTHARSDPRLPSRGSYGQPVAPTVEAANAHGRVTRPNGKTYQASGPVSQHGPGQSISRVPVPVRNSETAQQPPATPVKSQHKRSSTLGNLGERLFGRSGSILGGKQGDGLRGKKERKYPPTSMKDAYAVENASRPSIDSKRSFSFGLNKKKSVDLESQQQVEEKPKRFSSLIPSTFSFRGLSGTSKDGSEPDSPAPQPLDFQQPPSGSSRPSTQPARPSTGRGQYPMEQSQPHRTQPLSQDGQLDPPRPPQPNFSRPPQHQTPTSRTSNDVYGGTGVYTAGYQPQQQPQPIQQYPSSTNQTRPLYPEGFSSPDEGGPSISQNRQGRGVLQKNNRNFQNAHDYEQGRHEGSSGPARKVMDYFRRRKARTEPYQ